MNFPIFRTGLGQDSHAFLEESSSKKCIIGGIVIPDAPGLAADSDGDVILHAICNAITSVTGVSILGDIAIKLCKEKNITDSKEYVKEAFKTLQKQKIVHIALSVEGKRPRLQKHIPSIQKKVASLLQIKSSQIGITATTGDGLTSFGQGKGLQCLCILTTQEDS